MCRSMCSQVDHGIGTGLEVGANLWARVERIDAEKQVLLSWLLHPQGVQGLN